MHKTGEPSVLYKELRATYPAYAGILVLSFFITLLQLVPAMFPMQVMDRVLTSQNMTTLFFLALIALAMIAAWALLDHLRLKTLQRLSFALDAALGPRVFDAVQRSEPSKATPSGGAILADLNTLRDALGGQTVVMVFDLLMSPIFLIVLFLLHYLIGLTALAFIVAIAALSVLNQMLVAGSARRSQEASVQALEYANTVGRNGDIIRAMGMGPGLRARWHALQRSALTWQDVAQGRAGRIHALIKALRISEHVAIISLTAILIINQQVAVSALIAVILISSRAMGPIEAVIGSWRTVNAARNAFARLEGLFAQTEQEQDRIDLPRPNGALILQNLSATPPGAARQVLHDVTIAVPLGRVLAIVGPSGAGKSCLLRTACGIWRPTRGTVTLDGHDLQHWNPDALGRHIGYMAQDVGLLPGTVAENISRFYYEKPDPQAVEAAAQLARVEDLIKSLPEGYNTRIGPGGFVPSGGQRQRLALARAVFGEPRLVALDEPNSSLDASGEEALGATIRDLRERGCTVIVVTHKLSMLTHCDDVLVLNSGVVHASGSRDEIMKRLPPQRIVPLQVVNGRT